MTTAYMHGRSVAGTTEMGIWTLTFKMLIQELREAQTAEGLVILSDYRIHTGLRGSLLRCYCHLKPTRNHPFDVNICNTVS